MAQPLFGVLPRDAQAAAPAPAERPSLTNTGMKKLKNPRALFAMALLLLLFPMPSHAHKDTWLSLRPDGSLRGLPPAYGASRMKIAFAKDGPGLSELSFVSKGRENPLASCLLVLVKTRSIKDVRLAGSWYHDGGLPHYISVRFPDPGGEPMVGLTPGVEFLFSLQDARLLSAQRVSVDAAAQTAQHTEIPLTGQPPTTCSERRAP